MADVYFVVRQGEAPDLEAVETIVLTGKNEDSFSSGQNDDEIGTYHDGVEYQNSINFGGNIRGRLAVAIGKTRELPRTFTAYIVNSIPANGQKLTGLVKSKEHASDDAISIQDGSTWVKYEATFG